MAELPSKLHLTWHPMLLRIHGPSLYKDDKQRTWVHHVMETGGVLQVRLRKERIPRWHILRTTSPQTSSTMPSLWTLQPGNQYLDCLSRFWRIVHHIKDYGVEEMVLELKENSLDR